MRVLVTYASRYGATQGIAERVAAKLLECGLETTLKAARHAGDPADYDAVVVGSASYFFHWMKQAIKFVQRNADSLARRPVWLFSSGPLGNEDKNDQGVDLREFLVPKEIARFRESVKPRDHRVFFGAMDPGKLALTHRLIYKLPANRDNAIFPQGDFRNWAEIDAWADSIADALKTV